MSYTGVQDNLRLLDALFYLSLMLILISSESRITPPPPPPLSPFPFFFVKDGVWGELLHNLLVFFFYKFLSSDFNSIFFLAKG